MSLCSFYWWRKYSGVQADQIYTDGKFWPLTLILQSRTLTFFSEIMTFNHFSAIMTFNLFYAIKPLTFFYAIMNFNLFSTIMTFNLFFSEIMTFNLCYTAMTVPCSMSVYEFNFQLQTNDKMYLQNQTISNHLYRISYLLAKYF